MTVCKVKSQSTQKYDYSGLQREILLVDEHGLKGMYDQHDNIVVRSGYRWYLMIPDGPTNLRLELLNEDN